MIVSTLTPTFWFENFLHNIQYFVFPSMHPENFPQVQNVRTQFFVVGQMTFFLSWSLKVRIYSPKAWNRLDNFKLKKSLIMVILSPEMYLRIKCKRFQTFGG